MPKAKTTPKNERKEKVPTKIRIPSLDCKPLTNCVKPNHTKRGEKVPTQIPIPSLDCKPLTNWLKQITQREGKLHCTTMAFRDFKDVITLQNSRLVAYHFWTTGESVQVVLKVTLSSPCLWASFHPLSSLSMVSARK
jgi:hypothetical protein